MTIAPVLITIGIVVLIIVAIYKMAAFARSETERMRNLEKHSNEYSKNILAALQHKDTSAAIIIIAKEVGNILALLARK